MTLFGIVAILITISAVFSYVNHRTIRLPTTIGVMVISLFFSLGLIALEELGVHLERPALELLARIDFDETVLHGMLGFLLFAGALHVNVDDLLEQKWTIATLATVGVLISTVIVGALTWGTLRLLGLPIPFLYALLFGALISPTDPIAVLGILKSAGVPKSLEIKITGESLFNDGFGVVVFLVLLELASGSHDVSTSTVTLLFAQEVFGGALFGAAAGGLAYLMLKSVDNYQVEVLITLALVMGTYALADFLHLSGPIAIVVAGLLIGNKGRRLAMSDRTREHLDTFWELTDEVLNAVLFVLIGLEVLVLPFSRQALGAGLLVIPLVLFARAVSVGTFVQLLRRFRDFSPKVVRILTWAGLRGGISVALALSLPKGSPRDVIVIITYCVVVFSIICQGLTLKHVIARNR